MTDDRDVALGKRLKEARLLRNMSQAQVGRLLGVTFQQVQKYERGGNRISCSTLLDAATGLGLPVSWFFDGLGPAREDDMPAFIIDLAEDQQGRVLAETFLGLPQQERALALDLVQALKRAA